ncbi:PP2C family protein-serine/threonine phosphatase [Azotosporobacter soli]|uniref:PP2C family protein-serine/threonine phosphatase n=1 Tax=Azotosporobacter soli TaxID=3055040 RepID=UPI0031FE7D9E
MKPALHAEISVAQLSKHGEELCGDKVEIIRNEKHTIIALSDGLGSGVKANILSTLTTKIASSMLKRGIPLSDVVDTIAETLPVCRERKIAYSTLQIIKIAADGWTTLVEFDSPPVFLLRKGRLGALPIVEKEISGKLFRQASLQLREDDMLIAVTDGIIHAGIGAILKLGWGEAGVAQQLEEEWRPDITTETICNRIITCAEGFYAGQPGDDSTVVALKVRRPKELILLTGPPSDSQYDERIVKRFLSFEGSKVIAGGTTANIVSRVLQKPLIVDYTCHNRDIPPTAVLEGIDLVTEGILTLNAATEKLLSGKKIGIDLDGATRLAQQLLNADRITILAGGAINSAHQNPAFPMPINIKGQVLGKLQACLQQYGKQITIEWL